MGQKPVVISIIIVNYNVKRDLLACIESIYKSSLKSNFEIIVVDNSDKNIKRVIKNKFNSVIYFKTQRNLGFSAANNFGSRYASGKYLFFLNPDTSVENNSIEILTNFLELNKKTAIAAPLLLNPEGNPYKLQGSKKLTPFRAICSLSVLAKIFPENVIRRGFWLFNWNKKGPISLDVIPGSAFMIRNEIFKQVNGFDENYFLFFEENDICNKVKNLDLDIYILPNSRVVHSWGKSTSRSDLDIQKIFQNSRFYYFKKHFGFFQASITELILRINKEGILFFLILGLSIFLRFYKFNQNFTYDAEIADNLLDIKSAYFGHYIPLVGPPTSHPWLYFGPIFYWIYGPILVLSHFNPISHAYFGATISVITVFVCYYFTKKMFSGYVALVASFLVSISPTFVYGGNLARFMYMIPILIFPFIFFLFKVSSGKKKYLFLLFFIYTIMFSFHYTPLFLFPLIITIFLIKKIRLTRKDIGLSIFGFLLPLLPIFLYDSSKKFKMLKNLILWIPYRISGFLGIYPKNTLTTQVINENSTSFLKFFSFTFNESKNPPYYGYVTTLSILLLLFLIIYLVFKLRSFINNKYFPIIWMILILWGFWGLLALFIHGNAPLHYFVPLFPLPIIILSLALYDLNKKFKPFGQYIVYIFLFLLFISNMSFFFSKSWFFRNENTLTGYQIAQNVSHFIVNDAKDKQFELKRVGFNDMYKGNFAQNYIYLLWLYGNEPVKNSNLTYIIIENPKDIPKETGKNTQSYRIVDSIIIFKKTGN